MAHFTLGDATSEQTGGYTVLMSIESLIDAGRWEELSPMQQRWYSNRQAEMKAWSKSRRGRLTLARFWLIDHLPHLHLGPCKEYDE